MEKQTFTKQRWVLLLYVISMAVLLCLRDISGLNIHKIIFVALVLIVSVMCKYQTLLSIILFTFPLMSGLPGNYILPIWAILILYHQLNNGTANKWALIFSLTFIGWELILCSFLPYRISIPNIISYFSILIIFSLLVAEKYETIVYDIPVISFCIGCCVMLAIIFIQYVQDPSLMITEGGSRMGGDMYGNDGKMMLRTNANTIGYFSVSSIACALSLFYYKKIGFPAVSLIVLVSFICGLYSVSRTWAILLALTFVFYLIWQKENKRVGYMICAIFVFAVIYYLSRNQEVISVFVERFTGENIETGGERTTLFSEYNAFLLNHPVNLFWGTSTQFYKQVTGIFNSTHNALQQIWLCYGISGFILFIIAYVRTLRICYPKGQMMSCLPMLIVFMFLQSLQFLNPQNCMYPMIAAFFFMKMVKADIVTEK